MGNVSEMHKTTAGRIEFLDGLRGIAISVVLLFHAFARWPELYVYGNRFSGNPFFDTRIAGVNLFFVISGYVILMTLRKCGTFSEFIARRWLRLFPAMLLCSLLIWASSGLFPERPAGSVSAWDLLPGLSFIGDGPGTHHLWDALAAYIGHQVRSLDGSFWSLYVEVRFYLVFGLAYFLFGESIGISIIAALFLVDELSSDQLLSVHFGPSDLGGFLLSKLHRLLAVTGATGLSRILTAKAYGFFAAGALFFRFHATRRWSVFCLALLAGLLASLDEANAPAANLCLTLLFVLAVLSAQVQGILASRALVFIGFISYPLYLIHQNMMVAMIVKIGKAFPDMPALLIPALPICVVGSLAWIIAKYVEPATKAFLDRRSERAQVEIPAQSQVDGQNAK